MPRRHLALALLTLVLVAAATRTLERRPAQAGTAQECGFGAFVNGAGGTVSVNGGAPSTSQFLWIACGTEGTIVATADPGYCVDRWLLQAPLAGCPTTATYTHTPARAGVVHFPWVKFKPDPTPPPLTLTLTAARARCTAHTLTAVAWTIGSYLPVMDSAISTSSAVRVAAIMS